MTRPGTLIRMSWFGGRTPDLGARRARPARGPALWYGACIILGSGCLYTEPVWRINEPPVLLFPDIDPDGEYVHDLNASVFLNVVVEDSDSEEIQYNWTVDGVDDPVADYGSDGSTFYTSISLDRDPELDGELVFADLRDPLSGVELTVRFRIEMGGEF